MKTQIVTLKEFTELLLKESLHPELHQIIAAPTDKKVSKKHLLINKVKELTDKGEKTGFEGNMPSGSSRMFLKHEQPEDVHIDGHQAKMKTGTKVAIKASLDAYHNKEHYGGKSLGQLQNEAEGADENINNHYRILTKTGHKKFNTNPIGIFPPLVEHDHKTHEWSHVGHVDNIEYHHFPHLTKSPTFPNGIEHHDFVNVLIRSWDKKHGNYWMKGGPVESHLDKLEKHPLVDKFMTHQNEHHAPPHDYDQIENLGVWTHPVTGQKHIVARDHGYNDQVMKAYQEGNRNQAHGNPVSTISVSKPKKAVK